MPKYKLVFHVETEAGDQISPSWNTPFTITDTDLAADEEQTEAVTLLVRKTIEATLGVLRRQEERIAPYVR